MTNGGLTMLLWLKRFILAVQFLTRIPISIELEVDERDFAKSMVFFPAVGLLIGLLMLAGFYLGVYMHYQWLPVLIAAFIQTAITGVLHLDGLGDTCDGIFSNRPRERILEIMRDSRIGTNACAAIFFDLSAKVVLLAENMQLSPGAAGTAIVAAPVFGRMGIVTSASICEYARREGGLGKHFLDHVGWKEWILSQILGFAILIPVLGGEAFLLLLLIWVCAFAMAKYFEKKIGGLTGDTLGAVNEICEIVFLFLHTLFLRGGM